jgi:hypothetical protein
VICFVTMSAAAGDTEPGVAAASRPPKPMMAAAATAALIL